MIHKVTLLITRPKCYKTISNHQKIIQGNTANALIVSIIENTIENTKQGFVGTYNAMMLRFSLNQEAAAQRIEAAVKSVLAQGLRTADIFSAGTTRVSTLEMGTAVVKAL